jgi:two-component system chemotaxis sensor kinase CheA
MSTADDDMAEYFRMFVEETGEQLDALVEIMLRLEAAPDDRNLLAEAFRMIHSIKGSSALLGLEQITSLTHMLESHFDRLRSGRQRLDAVGMDTTLACVDFLRACNDDIREGRPLKNDPKLLARVEKLEQTAATVQSPPAAVPAEPELPKSAPAAASGDTESATESAASPPDEDDSEPLGSCRVSLRLRAHLPLVEMKVELLLARLADQGTIHRCDPPRDRAVQIPSLQELVVTLDTTASAAQLRQATDVDGVEAVQIDRLPAETTPDDTTPGDSTAESTATAAAYGLASAASTDDTSTTVTSAAIASAPPASTSAALSATIRVDVERLDVLLNLTGELVVNRARLAQLAGEIAPAFRKSHLSGGSAVETLRGLLADETTPRHHAQLLQLADDLEALEQQIQGWGEARSRFSELLEAVDQLTRVSSSLQRGVLETRMVPVGPLFGRFKRSVRDIANELGKKVTLELVGEKTELDKRMIDEIGDPLNHLIRNSIDHGIESAAARAAAGKPDVATVRLTASHRGNNVFITVEDDGGGIDSDRVRQTAVKRGLLSQATADTLADGELHELIWQPGFSTASKVSDISGRGVGMDIVRTKIVGLNGSIEVNSRRGEGTCFTIRLPLTLTIARCMLFRVGEGVFGVPIENVREIVSASGLNTVATGGRTLADIRGEMLPLVSTHDLFHWSSSIGNGQADAVIVLQSGHRLLGLRADTLLGGQDVVIKPLDENFLHVRGLGGASVLGDGSVCLLLDTASCIDLAQQERKPRSPTKAHTPQASSNA